MPTQAKRLYAVALCTVATPYVDTDRLRQAVFSKYGMMRLDLHMGLCGAARIQVFLSH